MQELDCGMVCYIHKKIKEVKSILDLDESDDNYELWEEEYAEIEREGDNL